MISYGADFAEQLRQAAGYVDRILKGEKPADLPVQAPAKYETGAETAKHATSVIPIVAAGVGDLVELGLVASLSHPGGNLTGFVASAPETVAKRFQIMKEIKPQAERVAVLWNADNSVPKLEWNAAKEFVAENKISALVYDAHNNAEGLRKALAEIAQSAPHMLIATRGHLWRSLLPLSDSLLRGDSTNAIRRPV